jgi:hypothetical protein
VAFAVRNESFLPRSDASPRFVPQTLQERTGDVMTTVPQLFHSPSTASQALSFAHLITR